MCVLYRYAFPLNPKWVLCDEGWLPIFKRLLASAEAQAPMEAWFLAAPHTMHAFSYVHAFSYAHAFNALAEGGIMCGAGSRRRLDFASGFLLSRGRTRVASGCQRKDSNPLRVGVRVRVGVGGRGGG